ncbi:MAG: PAS domain-containing protein, partial [Planctomycetales bacterium]|nr:PAS domain-containing protein [Planctomycetales bacterium]
ELTQLTSDMDNLLRSTEIGTIFLDTELRIRKFTPVVTRAFHVLEQDIGRPIGHIAHTLLNYDLISDAATVLQTREPIERSLETNGNENYLVRVLPYDSDRHDNGVVVTLIDTTQFTHQRTSTN